MALPELSVRRPITVLMATLAVVTFGVIAAGRLPIDLLPNLSYPTLTVQTVYTDAAPVSVERFVTRPVEEAVGVIPGVREMSSVSRPGLSEVVLEFEWGEEMDFAALEVREKLGLVELPREADPPRVLRYDPSLDPIQRLAFSGDRPLDEMRLLAERWLEPRLESILGVASARVRGGLDPEIVVEADEDRLAALGLTLGDLGQALRSENVNQPGGTLKDFNAVYLVRTLHEFTELEQLRRTVVHEGESGLVRVEDVATVSRGHRDREEITRLEGEEMVEIALHREGSANTVMVAQAVREELEVLRGELPEDLDITLLTDQSTYIEAAVDQVKSAAWIGAILAVLVLFFFLRDLPSTVIIALSIPVSVVATFLPMQQAGVSLNIMSLGGLALGVGMLVDNSIVVLEAIDRRRKEGAARRDASILGAGEVSGAVIASTLTTVSVFLPIVFVQGVAGQLFYDQAVTVCFSLLTSLVVSLTLIPSLAAFDTSRMHGPSGETLFSWDRQREEGKRLPWTWAVGPLELPPIGDGVHFGSKLLTALLFPVRLVLLVVAAILIGGWWVSSRLFSLVTAPFWHLFEGIEARYPALIGASLAHRGKVILLAFALFAVSIWSLPFLGTDLVPDLSQGEFAFQLRLPEGTPLEGTAETVAAIEGLLLGDEAFVRVFSMVGSLPSAASGRRTVGENLAQIDFQLAEGVDEATAVGRVRTALGRFPQADAELMRPSVLDLDAPVMVQVFSEDLDLLDEAAKKVQNRLASMPMLTDVASTSEPGSPEVRVELDRERAGSLGVTAADVAATLRYQVRGELVGQFREGEERIDIRLRAAEIFRDRATGIESLRLRLPGGAVVPVSSVAKVQVDRGPAAIYRAGGSRVAEVSASAASGEDLGQVAAAVASSLTDLETLQGVKLELGGREAEMAVSFASLRLALMLATFLVYVVMAAQFESLLHPFVILMAVPLGLVGVVAALFLTGTSISVLVLIGAVMLAGIVVNNAIVLLDAVNRRRREGEELEAALVGAGSERLRPIVMTTATTVLALLPMALGLGAGDELRAPLAVTVIGGLLVATLLTLVVTPCLYRLFSRSGASMKEEESEISSLEAVEETL